MARFNAVDLARLAPPPVIEVISYEDILAGMLADFIARFPDYDVGGLESDPAKKVLEVAAWREMVLRQRVNDAARAVMVATALGGDLEHLGALFGVDRQVVDPGNPDASPPIPPTLEDIERYRERVQLSIEAYSTAGPYGAYTFYGLDASPQVKDVAVYGPESGLVTPGQVGVYVLSIEGNGTAGQPLLDTVRAAFADEDRRPLTDHVLVNAATVTTYAIGIEIEVAGSLDAGVVEAEVLASLERWRQSRHRIAAVHRLSAISGSAICIPGVEDVIISSPLADIDPGPTGAAYCTGITITTTVAA